MLSDAMGLVWPLIVQAGLFGLAILAMVGFVEVFYTTRFVTWPWLPRPERNVDGEHPSFRKGKVAGVYYYILACQWPNDPAHADGTFNELIKTQLVQSVTEEDAEQFQLGANVGKAVAISALTRAAEKDPEAVDHQDIIDMLTVTVGDINRGCKDIAQSRIVEVIRQLNSQGETV